MNCLGEILRTLFISLFMSFCFLASVSSQVEDAYRIVTLRPVELHFPIDEKLVDKTSCLPLGPVDYLSKDSIYSRFGLSPATSEIRQLNIGGLFHENYSGSFEPFKSNNVFDVVYALVEVSDKDGPLMVTFDMDRDFDFSNDTAVLLFMELPKLIRIPFYLGAESKEAVDIPVQIRANGKRSRPSIVVNNLFAHEADMSILTAGLKVTIHYSYYGQKFQIYTKDVSSDSVKEQWINLMQPFKFGDHFYSLQNVDFNENTASLIEKGENELPYWDKPGYYINKDTFFALVRSRWPVGVEENLDDHRYFLLNFWGPWCTPCRQNMEFVKQIDDAIDRRDSLLFIHVLTSLDLTDTSSINPLLREGKVSELQVRQSLNEMKCKQDFRAFKEGCSLLSLLHIHSYPTYMLIRNDGMVMAKYVGKDYNDEIVQKLNKLGVDISIE